MSGDAANSSAGLYRSVIAALSGSGDSKQLTRGAIASFFIKAGNAALAFLISVVLARILGTSGYGAYAYAVSWAVLLAAPSLLGLDLLITREMSRYAALEEWGLQRGVMSWTNGVVLVSSFGLAFAFAAAVFALRGRLEPHVARSLWLAAFILPLFAFMRLKQGSVWGLGHVVDGQLPQMIVLPGLLLILALGFHQIRELSAPFAVGLRAAAAAGALIYAAVRLRRYLPQQARAVERGLETERWKRAAFPLLVAGAAPIINDQVAVVILGSLAGADAAGVYDVARKGAMLVAFALISVNVPLAPAFARLHARGETARLQQVVTKGARTALLGSLPVALGLIIFRDYFLALFGSGFGGAGLALVILCLGQVANAAMGSVGFLLNMTGHEWDVARGIGLAAVLNIVLTLTLVPVWGIEGAAVATAVSVLIWNVLLAVMAYKRLGIYTPAIGRSILGRS